MAHDVFISYSSKDKHAGNAVCSVLERHGIRCWMAPRDIVPGVGWARSIIGAINGARAMVLVFSGNANASPQVEREVERAINKGVPIIPLRIEDITPSGALEYFLSAPHWLDAFSPPLEQHLDRLAEAVRTLLSSDFVAHRPGSASPTSSEAAAQTEQAALDPKTDAAHLPLESEDRPDVPLATMPEGLGSAGENDMPQEEQEAAIPDSVAPFADIRSRQQPSVRLPLIQTAEEAKALQIGSGLAQEHGGRLEVQHPKRSVVADGVVADGVVADGVAADTQSANAKRAVIVTVAVTSVAASLVAVATTTLLIFAVVR